MIFRLSNQGDETIEGWGEISGPLNGNLIQGAHDTNPNHLINSIPSPFAQVNTTEEAFKFVAENGVNNLETLNHNQYKLVSDSLDIMEILFNFSRFSNEISISRWSQDLDLDSLENSQNFGTNIYGKTIDLFLKQDKKSNNFSEKGNLFYIIKFKTKIIGTSSNTTFVFPTQNPLFDPNNKIQFNDDFAFDENYNPLFKRSKSFQKYIYSIFKRMPELKEKMKAFYKYTELNKQKIQESDLPFFNEILGIDNEYCEKAFQEINLNGLITINGFNLKYQDSNIQDIQSDLFINSDNKIKKVPMLLDESVNTGEQFVNDQNWSQTFVPQLKGARNILIENRNLPGLGAKYPYLIKEDLLEDDLIQVPYVINEEKFITGNLHKLGNPIKYVEDNLKNRFTYLLPINRNYFTFFSASNLQKDLKIEVSNPNVVHVSLKIPLKNGKSIYLKKTYKTEPNDDSFGKIISLESSISISPFLKILQDNFQPIFSLQTIEKNIEESTFKFYSKGQELEESDVFYYRRNTTDKKKSLHFRINKNFDVIQIQNKNSKGVIIPKFIEEELGEINVKYAIDFGTSNTHIEYREGNKAPVSLKYKEGSNFINPIFEIENTTDTFNRKGTEFKDFIEREFLPLSIGTGAINFPIGTIINENPNKTEQDKRIQFLDKRNIGFDHVFLLKKVFDDKNKFIDNLKWAEDIDNVERVKEFINQLLFMVRNHALIKGFNLKNIEIIWFHPTSMPVGKVNSFRDIWKESYEKIIGNNSDGNLREMPETAPFYYLKHEGLIDGGYSNASFLIDIGGGTCDIVLYEDEKEKLISSLIFAGNDIWGGNLDLNKFKIDFEPDLANFRNSISDEDSKVRDIDNLPSLLSLIFKAEEVNKDTLNDNSFVHKLKTSPKLKVLFLYFYFSIIYYVANLARDKNINKFGKIAFTGNGSKILNFITTDRGTLNSYTKKIFQQVINNAEIENVKTELAEYPKESCCKGGLYAGEEAVILSANEINKIVYSYNFSLQKNFDRIQVEEKVELMKNDLKDLNKSFFEINNELDYEENFSADKNTLKNIELFLSNSINYDEILKEYFKKNQHLEQKNTVFIFDILKQIIQEIYKSGIV